MRKSKVINCEGNSFKSQLELYFYFYLKELKEKDFIDNIRYEKSTFKLTEPYRRNYSFQGKRSILCKSESLLHKSSITSDFTFNFMPKSEGIFYIGKKPINCLVKEIPFRLANQDGLECLVEVKSIQERSTTSSNVSFPYKQKFCLYKYNKLIYKVKPYSNKGRGCLFETTFTPSKVLEQERYVRDCKYGKRGASKIKFTTRTLGDFLKDKISE